VSNLCDLPTKVKASMVSKVVSLYLEDREEALVGSDVTEGSFVIAPRSTRNLSVWFVARKVNLNYEKTVRFDAVAAAPVLLTVKASNLDNLHIIYHSLFYKVSQP